nr:hypothetical protein [Tanacetum cinerariifolium]
MNSDNDSNLMKIKPNLVAWKLLGSSGVSSGSGVEVVEWSGEWGREGCCSWREK